MTLSDHNPNFTRCTITIQQQQKIIPNLGNFTIHKDLYWLRSSMSQLRHFRNWIH